MNANDYQVKAMRTNNEIDLNKSLINGVLGLSGETGEVADILKKHLFQGHDLDKSHMAEELGDICWYLAITAQAIGYDLADIMELNITKLELRYPNGFDADKSINRE